MYKQEARQRNPPRELLALCPLSERCHRGWGIALSKFLVDGKDLNSLLRRFTDSMDGPAPL
jgi:hypothetical protein